MARTRTEILEAITFLQKRRRETPQFSFFGDNNHDAIDRMIDVLQSNMSEETIYEMESNGLSSYSVDAMIAARDFLDGTGEIEDLF